MGFTEIIGWFSTTVLVLTIGRQVWTQYRSGSTQGVSKWLFIGQLTASTGFVIYSFLLSNWVFVVSNLMLLVLALIGEALYLKNRRRQRQAPGSDGARGAGAAAARP